VKRLLAFESSIRLASYIGGSVPSAAEEAREDGLKEGSEDDLGTVGDRESHPQDENKLEDVVEGEPVDGVDQALKDIQEGVNNPVCQPLCVINLAGAEQGFQRVVTRDDEPGKIYKKLAADVEEDQEEVQSHQAEEDINLGNIGLLLEVVERRVLGKFLIDLGDLVLSSVLERHFDIGKRR